MHQRCVVTASLPYRAQKECIGHAQARHQQRQAVIASVGALHTDHPAQHYGSGGENSSSHTTQKQSCITTTRKTHAPAQYAQPAQRPAPNRLFQSTPAAEQKAHGNRRHKRPTTSVRMPAARRPNASQATVARTTPIVRPTPQAHRQPAMYKGLEASSSRLSHWGAALGWGA